MVSPSSSTVENVFPNNPTSSINFSPNLNSIGPLNNGLLKIDYNIGPRNHLNGLYYRSSATQTTNIIAEQSAPQWLANVPQNAYQYDGDWTFTPNSTWVNDFRLGYVYVNFTTYPGDINTPAGSPYPGGYGMPTGVTSPVYGGFPLSHVTSFNMHWVSAIGLVPAGRKATSILWRASPTCAASTRSNSALSFSTTFLTGSFSLAQGNVDFLSLQITSKVFRRIGRFCWVPRKRIHRMLRPTGSGDSFRMIGA